MLVDMYCCILSGIDDESPDMDICLSGQGRGLTQFVSPHTAKANQNSIITLLGRNMVKNSFLRSKWYSSP